MRTVLLIVFLLVPVVNFGSFLIPGAGDRFADDPQTRVDAAGYAFSIWTFIFIAMIAFCFRLFREPLSKSLRRSMIMLATAGIASIAFVPISIAGNQLLGWIDIAVHLAVLAIGWLALREHARSNPSRSSARWSFIGPSLYFGWISAAFVISTALALDELQISLPSNVATLVACGTLITIGGVAIGMVRHDDPFYGATIAWALIAIGVEQEQYAIIRGVAWTLAALIGIYITYRNRESVHFYAVSA